MTSVLIRRYGLLLNAFKSLWVARVMALLMIIVLIMSPSGSTRWVDMLLMCKYATGLYFTLLIIATYVDPFLGLLLTCVIIIGTIQSQKKRPQQYKRTTETYMSLNVQVEDESEKHLQRDSPADTFQEDTDNIPFCQVKPKLFDTQPDLGEPYYTGMHAPYIRYRL